MTNQERAAARRIGELLAGERTLQAAFADTLQGDLLRMRARRRLKQALGCSIERAEMLVDEVLTP